MKIDINLKDIKDIADNVRQGHSELEVALARKALAYRDALGRQNDDRRKLFDTLYSVHTALERSGHAGWLHARRKADLAGRSKAHFAAAVELDRELKAMDANEKELKAMDAIEKEL